MEKIKKPGLRAIEAGFYFMTRRTKRWDPGPSQGDMASLCCRFGFYSVLPIRAGGYSPDADLPGVSDQCGREPISGTVTMVLSIYPQDREGRLGTEFTRT